MQCLIQLCIGSLSSVIGSLRHNAVQIWGESGESRIKSNDALPLDRPCARVECTHDPRRSDYIRPRPYAELDQALHTLGVMYSWWYIIGQKAAAFRRWQCWFDTTVALFGRQHILSTKAKTGSLVLKWYSFWQIFPSLQTYQRKLNCKMTGKITYFILTLEIRDGAIMNANEAMIHKVIA